MESEKFNQEQFKEFFSLLREYMQQRNAEPSMTKQKRETTEELFASFKQKSTMAKCNVRFHGQYNRDAVEEFINGVETFKDLENITNEDALKGISLLLKDTAALWWQGIRKQAESWQDFIRLIRQHFSPPKQAYQLYMELFAEIQDEKKSLDLFVIEKRNLLAQLPEGRHDESTEIDFIYGMLNIKYRQFMRREEIKTFQDLLEKGRDIESNHNEIQRKEKTKIKRCSHCNYRGHASEECRRYQQEQQQQQQHHHQKQECSVGDSKKKFGNKTEKY